MGYTAHHAIIIASYDPERTMQARDVAQLTGLICTDIHPWAINRGSSFAVLPDGSKEGWPESDEFDGLRDKFVKWLDAQKYDDGSSPFSWAEVRISPDDKDSIVTRHVYGESQ